jgi:arylsulfatase A-like enzyme
MMTATLSRNDADRPSTRTTPLPRPLRRSGPTSKTLLGHPFRFFPGSALLLAIGLVASGPLAAAAAPPQKPNIILFLIDDQDKSSIGAYGGKTYTPALDRMAAEGMKFNQAYVSSAVCTPSRYTFLTGRYAGNSTSKLYDQACGGPDRQGQPAFNVTLERDRMNVGHVLRSAGYVTGFVGKFHLESEVDFPEFYRGPDGLKPVPRDAVASPATSALFAHNERVLRRYVENLGFSWAKHVYPGNMDAPYNQHNPEWTIEAALEFIELNKDRPFYLHYCTTLLHGPSGSWRRSMDHPLSSGAGELKALPDVMTPRSELLEKVAAQGLNPNGEAAGEAWVDDSLGAVFRKLRELGLDKDTLVLFAPDHGRRGKTSLFTQDGTGIPMIARWPARIPVGATCDELVLNTDWVPTVFEIAGVRKPAGYRIDGRSLLPLLEGRKDAPVREHVFLEMGHARGIATKDWKYIAVRYPREQIEVIKHSSLENLPRVMSYIGRLGIGVRGAERAGFWDEDQLYDLRNDPDERMNLARDPRYAAQLAALRRTLTEELQAGTRPFGEFVPGPNTAPPGQIDRQIAQAKNLIIQGKTVIVPDENAEKAPGAARQDQRKADRKKKKSQ